MEKERNRQREHFHSLFHFVNACDAGTKPGQSREQELNPSFKWVAETQQLESS